jgi:adenylate kinase
MKTIIITGTPGTGKTTVSKIISNKLESSLIAVNDLIEEKHIYNGYDAEKGYKLVDIDALSKEISVKLSGSNDEYMIVEGHLAHEFNDDEHVDIVIVLRARPDILRKRLNKRNWSHSKVQENIEAEALDICTFESVELHREKVHELDTSDLDADEVADIIIEIVSGKKNFPPGNLNFLDDLYS